MNNKESIIQATIDLIQEKSEDMDGITVREICQRANVGLGLVNYHFGNKDKLIELCVERMVNGIVERFRSMGEQTENLSPAEKLDYLGNMTLNFLFDHYALSRISILSDMRVPKEDDNTQRTYMAYLPLVSACRPDWDKETLARRTFYLITVMQQAVLQHQLILKLYGINLTVPKERRAFHSAVLHDILEV